MRRADLENVRCVTKTLELHHSSALLIPSCLTESAIRDTENHIGHLTKEERMTGLDRASVLCFAAALAVSTPLAADESIARWVDADGVTQFGNVQFAPDDATRLSMAPTNGMDVPEALPRSSSARGPVWTVINRQPRQNRVGWRSKGEGPKYGHVSPSQR